MTDADALRERLVGRPFPGGTFTVPEHERWLAHDAIQAPELPAPLLHPVWILMGALRGMGMALDDLIELAEATPEDGVLFGETEIEQRTPLRSGVAYSVVGEITEVVRRQGRRAGPFDVLSFELRIAEPSGAVAAVSRQSFVFPRRAEADDA